MNLLIARLRATPRRWLAMLALPALVLGCGGGVGTGGTGSFAVGPITGFGSIIVNGVRYDDRSARIEADDGSTRPNSALRLGMVVEVDASVVTHAQAVADRVRVVSELIGRVEAVEATQGRLTVNGQSVRTQSATVFDDAFGNGLASVGVGAVVEVYGFADGASGAVLATRIEPRSGASAFKFRGEVSALNRSERTFSIGTQRFSYATLDPVPQALADRAIVRVEVGTATDANGRWAVSALASGVAPREEAEDAEADGVITAFTSNADFQVNGLRVDAGGATIAGGPLALGLRVEVGGRLSGGVLIARKVTVEGDAGGGQFELHGTVANLDVVARTFRIAGRSETVSYARPDLVFENGSVADLINGRLVEVRGVLASGGTRIEATRIEFD
jgi:hypothetical protein